MGTLGNHVHETRPILQKKIDVMKHFEQGQKMKPILSSNSFDERQRNKTLINDV